MDSTPSLRPGEQLRAISPKDKPWDIHRASAELVAALYQDDFAKLSFRINKCSYRLGFVREDMVAPGEQRPPIRLVDARFCRVRHCPVCQWRRQLMWRARFFKALPAIERECVGARYLFLTLTVRNCHPSELGSTLSHMNKSWDRLTKRKAWPAHGFVRSTEITRNAATGEAHPHFHCLLMVRPSYFSGEYYISQQRWRELWQACLKSDYLPVVNIKAVKPGPSGFISKSLLETLKYSIKPSDLVADKDWLIEVTKQLKNVRMVSVGGTFKEFISSEDPTNLITEGENDPQGADLAELFFQWETQFKQYRRTAD